jgi:RHS repeat-associated protein
MQFQTLNNIKLNYPFGSVIATRAYSSGEYRFGFQGQEGDDEISGKGNFYNYKYRMHDTRLGRFFVIDPLSSEYAFNSPYAFSENRVIDATELEGLESSMQWKIMGDGFAHFYSAIGDLFTLNSNIGINYKSDTRINGTNVLVKSTSIGIKAEVKSNLSQFILSAHQFGSTTEPLMSFDIALTYSEQASASFGIGNKGVSIVSSQVYETSL